MFFILYFYLSLASIFSSLEIWLIVVVVDVFPWHVHIKFRAQIEKLIWDICDIWNVSGSSLQHGFWSIFEFFPTFFHIFHFHEFFCALWGFVGIWILIQCTMCISLNWVPFYQNSVIQMNFLLGKKYRSSWDNVIMNRFIFKSIFFFQSDPFDFVNLRLHFAI